MKIFHGGCHGCVRQEEFGETFCHMCCYYEPDWNKPNLFKKSEDAKIEEMSKSIPHYMRKDLIKKWIEELF